MNIVPRSRAPFHTPTPPFAGRRWAGRVYPGDLVQAAWVREDLRADLYRLEGLCPDQSETIVLCASEMFANACDHSRSGQRDGRVLRTLSMPAAHTLCVSTIDDGARDEAPTLPRIPHQRTPPNGRRPNAAVGCCSSNTWPPAGGVGRWWTSRSVPDWAPSYGPNSPSPPRRLTGERGPDLLRDARGAGGAPRSPILQHQLGAATSRTAPGGPHRRLECLGASTSTRAHSRPQPVAETAGPEPTTGS